MTADPIARGLGARALGGFRSGVLVQKSRIVAPSRVLTRRVMAAAPTTTLTTSHTITSPLQWPMNSNTGGANNTTQIAASSFSIMGAGAPVAGTGFPNSLLSTFSNVNYGGGTLSFNAVKVGMMHYGSELEFQIKGTGAFLLVKINDEYLSLTPTTVTNDGSVYYYYIPFGSTALRRVEFITNGSIGGVFTGQTDTITPAPVRGPRVIVVGDSFTEGTGATGLGVTNYVQAFADAMGWDDVWSSGVGGTGYLNNGTTKLTYRGRVATDVIPFAPDVVIFTGGINDSGTSAQFQTEAALLFAQVKASLPNCLICAAAPFTTGGASKIPATLSAAETGIQAAITGIGGVYLNILAQPLPAQYVVQTLTLASAAALSATSLSVTTMPALRGTYQFADGTRFQVKSFSGSANPFTITTDGPIRGAQLISATATQVGDCFWTGIGRVGALTGYGNSDIFVSSDTTHPTQAGHDALGAAMAALLIQALPH